MRSLVDGALVKAVTEIAEPGLLHARPGDIGIIADELEDGRFTVLWQCDRETACDCSPEQLELYEVDRG